MRGNKPFDLRQHGQSARWRSTRLQLRARSQNEYVECKLECPRWLLLQRQWTAMGQWPKPAQSSSHRNYWRCSNWFAL